MSTAPIARWANYFLRSGADFESFWGEFLCEGRRRLLFILGRGFDPRMCDAIEVLLRAKGESACECVLLEYDEGPTSPSQEHQPLVADNLKKLNRLLTEAGCAMLPSRTIRMESDDGRRIGSVSAARVFQSVDELCPYTDCVLDISAMPRAIYLPLLHELMYLVDNPGPAKAPNLHVVVSENPRLDAEIRDQAIDENAEYLHSFSAVDMEATAQMPTIWIPLLGEGQSAQLQKIRDLVKPHEVCPLLPFPALNPRRADNLIREYQTFLFDEMRLDPSNFLYAHERNPFQAYRQVQDTVERYERSLQVLDGCKAVVSALSSKLLSIGAFLAVYELRLRRRLVGIAHVEARGYGMSGGGDKTRKHEPGELFELWLAGECYAP